MGGIWLDVTRGIDDLIIKSCLFRRRLVIYRSSHGRNSHMAPVPTLRKVSVGVFSRYTNNGQSHISLCEIHGVEKLFVGGFQRNCVRPKPQCEKRISVLWFDNVAHIVNVPFSSKYLETALWHCKKDPPTDLPESSTRLLAGRELQTIAGLIKHDVNLRHPGLHYLTL